MLSHVFIDEGNATPTTRYVRVFLVLALLGGIAALAVYELRRQRDQARWIETPCTIILSGVDVRGGDVHDEHAYHFWAHYRFNAGIERIGKEFRQTQHGFDDAADAYALARRYRPGTQSVCYYDPADPSRRVLQREAAETPILLFAVLAVGAVALIPFYVVPQMRLALGGKVRPQRAKPAANKRRSEWWAGLALVVGGIAWLTFGTVIPVWKSIQAATRWPSVPCTIVASGVARSEVHGEVHVTLYRPDVLYRYDVGGETYHSNYFSHTDSKLPWRYGKRALAAAYHPNTQATCRVDPTDPTNVVLTTAPSATLGFALLPIGFTALGAATMWQNRSWRRRDLPRTISLNRSGPTLVLLAAAGFGAMFAGTSRDLYRDWRSGTSDTFELVVVVILGLITAILAISAGVLRARIRAFTDRMSVRS